MYDDEIEDDDEGEVEAGPASGGYGTEFPDIEDESAAIDQGVIAREERERAHGAADRAYFDQLAQEEDHKHNAMRKDVARRSLLLGELRQKIRHKETELHTIDRDIRELENMIDLERKRKYQRDALMPQSGVGGPENVTMTNGEKDDAREKEAEQEFSLERALAHIATNEEKKKEINAELTQMTNHLHEEERVYSQLEHEVQRM